MFQLRTLLALVLVLISWLFAGSIVSADTRQEQLTYIHLAFAALCVTLLNGFVIYVLNWTWIHIVVLWTWITIGFGIHMTLFASISIYLVVELLRQCMC